MQQGTQLAAQQGRAVEADADRAPPHRRIRLPAAAPVGQHLAPPPGRGAGHPRLAATRTRDGAPKSRVPPHPPETLSEKAPTLGTVSAGSRGELLPKGEGRS